MSRAEVYVACQQRASLAHGYDWWRAWLEAADIVSFHEEINGRGDSFWAEVDTLNKENR